MNANLHLALYVVAATFTTSGASLAHGAAAGTAMRLPMRTEWIDRPWELRYVVQIDDGMGYRVDKEGTTRRYEEDLKEGTLYTPRVFDEHHRIEIKPGKPDHDLVVTLIEFDQQGRVTTPNSHGGPLQGRLNAHRAIVLATGEGRLDPVYELGEWFQGFGGSELWSPTLCWHGDLRTEVNHNNPYYLYGRKFRPERQGPTFGCREWAYQLRDDKRPYIDVTSYRPKAKPEETYIRRFIGWARFQDRKPVIGLHLGNWYCLLDCPKSDAPGRIDDIKKWVAANGWPAPKQPKRMPMFPDSTAQRDVED